MSRTIKQAPIAPQLVSAIERARLHMAADGIKSNLPGHWGPLKRLGGTVIVLNNATTKWIPPDGTQLTLLGKTEERKRDGESGRLLRTVAWYFHLLLADGSERHLRVEMGGLNRAKRIAFVSSTEVPEWILAKFMENDPVLETPVESLNLFPRAYNCLKKTRIDTLGQLARCSERDLLDIRELGLSTLREIIDRLAEFGLTLKPTPHLFS